MVKGFQSSNALVAGMISLPLFPPILARARLPQTSRATFPTGCILDEDNALDFFDRDAVYECIEVCVCLFG
ncbi:MAG: hypothetical protein J7647_08760 [Cyanobacteria bacterium SBLK]|nr:hypothetical protein [Cyanobacteria bacterium SBLK]